MNVLLTLTAYPPSIGGAQLLMHHLARKLMSQHLVQVATQWDTNRTDWLLGTTLRAPLAGKAYVVDGVPIRQITLSASARRRLVPWVWGYYAVQGRAIGHIAKALMADLLPLAALADLVHNCRIGREGLSYASLQAARVRSIPFVFTPVHHPRWGGWLHRHYHHLYRCADAVIALTEAERQTLVRLGVNEQRVHVTGMGPVLAPQGDGLRFRQAHGLGSDPMVLFLGQKYPYKGLVALAAAAKLVWRRVPDARFVFVGPRTAYSRQLFREQTDARLLELDTVGLQAKTDALAACDVLCVPSTQESFGGVYTEAWSLGKPVIAADVPVMREVIEDGQDGFVVPQAAAPIAERLEILLLNPTLSAKMGRRGHAKVQARFTWDRLASLTEQVYEQVLQR